MRTPTLARDWVVQAACSRRALSSVVGSLVALGGLSAVRSSTPAAAPPVTGTVNPLFRPQAVGPTASLKAAPWHHHAGRRGTCKALLYNGQLPRPELRRPQG